MRMEERMSRILMAVVVLSFVTAGSAAADTIDGLVTNEAAIVLKINGSDDTRAAYEQTASFEAFHQSGLADAFDRFLENLPWEIISDSMGLGDSEVVSLHDIRVAAAIISRFGGTLAISIPADDAMPVPYAMLVINKGGAFTDALTDIFGRILSSENADSNDAVKPEIETINVGQRMIRRFNDQSIADSVTVAWWSESEDLVVYFGLPKIASILESAEKPKTRLVNSEAWTRAVPQQTPAFTETVRLWVNTRKLLDHYGKLLPLPIEVTPDPIQLAAGEAESAPSAEETVITVADLIRRLGLQQVDSVTLQTGYQGRHLVTRTEFATSGPRTGLMKLYDHEPVSLNDLPPLPAGVTSFHIRSLNPQSAYKEVLATIDRLVMLLPDSVKAQWIKTKRETIAPGKFDAEAEFFKHLGHVVCTFNDTRQEILGWGRSTVAVSVSDSLLLERGLDYWMEQVNSDENDSGKIVKLVRHGCPFFAGDGPGTFITPSIAICDGWMVVGWQPQTVEAFILRSQGKLPSWDTENLGKEARSRIPERFTALSWSDPRESVRLSMSLVPWAAELLKYNLAAATAGEVDWSPKISALDIPPVEVVLQPLFPNVTITSVDALRVKSTAWQSTRSNSALGWIVGAYAALPLLGALGFDFVNIQL